MTDEVIPTTESTPQPVNPTNWLDSLENDYKSDPSLKDIKDINSLAKSYIHAQKTIGNSLRIPTNDTAPEKRDEFYKKLMDVPGVVKLPDVNNKADIDQFYNKIGRPETADKYNFKLDEYKDLFEYKIVTDDHLKAYKNFAHNLGLTNDQAASLTEFQLAKDKNTLEMFRQQSDKNMNLIKQHFGDDFKNRTDAAKAMVTKYKDVFPDAYEEIVNGIAGSNPILVTALADLAKMYSEKGDILPSGRRLDFGQTPEEAKDKINEIKGNKNHPVYQQGHPEHHKALEEMKRLYAIAYPENK